MYLVRDFMSFAKNKRIKKNEDFQTGTGTRWTLDAGHFAHKGQG